MISVSLQHSGNTDCYSTFADLKLKSIVKEKMTSITPRLNSSHPRKNGRYPVVIQVIRHRVKREIFTPYCLSEAEFKNLDSLSEIEVVSLYLDKICRELALIGYALHREKGEVYTCADLVDTYRGRTDMRQLFAYADSLVSKLQSTGHSGTASNYCNACRALERFVGGRVLAFSDFTAQCVDDFMDFLRARGNCENTAVCYLKQLRAIYNKALRVGIVKEDLNPFRNQSFHCVPTRKRALPLKELQRLIKTDFRREHRDVCLARDLFLASFYGCGIPFTDLCRLRKEHIEGNFLCYKRHKTHQLLRVRIEKPLRELFARYADPHSPYLFPMLRGFTDEDRGYHSAKDRLSKRIRRVGELLGMTFSLTFHVARHTWATLAHNAGIELSVVSSCLGHTSEKTTRIYLAEMDTKKLARANCVVLKMVTGKGK